MSGSDNWVVQNLENALETWNSKLSEIWSLISQSPSQFKGGTIWNVILDINGALQAIGFGLLVLFFVLGVVTGVTGVCIILASKKFKKQNCIKILAFL